jgi:hypothetical protein
VAARFWIKLYLEILDDPKMGRLPDHLWRRAVELFLLAGRAGNDGALPALREYVQARRREGAHTLGQELKNWPDRLVQA